MQVLKDLKEKVHTDDISNVLILNKKAIANQENQLFQAELEKFRSHQNRLISTVHKQASLLKELTKSYGDLLQDKRVRSDQQRYDAMQKSKSSVMNKYRRVFNAHEDLIQGLMRAQGFYSEMKESVDSLEKNVESFVSNRRAEGAQLLHSIEQTKNSSADGQAAAEQKRMQELMNRLSMEPKPISPSQTEPPALPPLPPINASRSPAPISPSYPTTNPILDLQFHLGTHLRRLFQMDIRLSSSHLLNPRIRRLSKATRVRSRRSDSSLLGIQPMAYPSEVLSLHRVSSSSLAHIRSRQSPRLLRDR